MANIRHHVKRALSRLCVRATWPKPARMQEWMAVVRNEGRRLGIGALARILAKAALKRLARGKTAGRAWRARIRACSTCPVYNRALHACRDDAGLNLGCGCWMPAKASDRGATCWGCSVGMCRW